MRNMCHRRGLSPVIATIIISGVVMVIGGGIWAYAQSAAIVIGEDYVNGTLALLDEITERFIVEWVAVRDNGANLTIWIYDYGGVNIEVDVYVTVDDGNSGSTMNTEITAGSCTPIVVSFAGDPLQDGDEVSIKVYSRRQNTVYYLYYM